MSLASPSSSSYVLLDAGRGEQARSTWLWWAFLMAMTLVALTVLITGVLSLFNRRLQQEVAERTARLSREVERRRSAESMLEQHNQALEQEVARRTGELAAEVEHHRRTVARLSETASKLTEAREAAEEANRAKTEFLANMSHEIRTPLNAIIGFNQLLRQSPLEQRQLKQLEGQYESARMLQGIIGNILDFSRIEAGRLELESVGFDLRQVLNNVREQAERDAEVKGLSLRFEIDDRLPDHLRGDPLRLAQVLNNLVGNAVKFTEKGGVTVRVEVEERSADGSARLRLR